MYKKILMISSFLISVSFSIGAYGKEAMIKIPAGKELKGSGTIFVSDIKNGFNSGRP